MRVGGYDFCRVLIDIGSSLDLLFLSTLHALGIREEDIVKNKIPLVGFNNNMMYVIRMIKLSINAIGFIIITNFVIVDTLINYNLILVRP